MRLGVRTLLRRFWTRAVSGCRAKAKLDSRSYKILGAADWKTLKYVFFLYPFWFSFLDMFSIFSIYIFNFVLVVSFLLLFFVILVFSIIICHYSCVFRLLLNGSFIFDPFLGNLCNFDTCSLIFVVFPRFCIDYLTSRSKFILYYFLLCPTCFNLLFAVQKQRNPMETTQAKNKVSAVLTTLSDSTIVICGNP